MPGSGPILQPLVNIGAAGLQLWTQSGYSYGRNDSGNWQHYEEEGPTALIDLDSSWFLTHGWTYTVTHGKAGMAKLTADAGWNGGTLYTEEVLEQIWEFDPQETDKAILEADFPFTDLSGLDSLNLNTPASGYSQGSAGTRKMLAQIINDPAPFWGYNVPSYPGVYFVATSVAPRITWWFDDGLSSPYDENNIALPSADYPAAYSLYKLMAADVSQFPIDAPIIKHTQMFSNLAQISVAYPNVGRIISAVSMAGIEGFPNTGGAVPTIFFGLPDTPSPGQFIETPGDLQYGWKKSMPEVTRLALFKWRAVNNYHFGLWPIRLFGAVL